MMAISVMAAHDAIAGKAKRECRLPGIRALSSRLVVLVVAGQYYAYDGDSILVWSSWHDVLSVWA